MEGPTTAPWAWSIRDTESRITRWVGTNTNIDEQERTTRALARLHDSLEPQVAVRTAERDSMWRLSADLMLISVLQCNILSINPAWCAVLGRAPTELLARNFFDCVHPLDQEKTQEEMARRAEGYTTCY